MERLNKFIANSGYTSRRKADDLILKGKVSVNGDVVRELGTKVSSLDEVLVEGVSISKVQKYEYYLLNKPRGYICSLSDEKNRNVVVDLIDTDCNIYPVGRLDYNTTGALILTNDGDLANILMHPSNEVLKTYLAICEGIFTTEEIYKVEEGVTIDGVKVVPRRFKIKSKDPVKNRTKVEITIVEGKNHIVKNIFQSVGHPVNKLTRERIAFLDVKGLQSGEYRELTINEVKRLKQLKKGSK